MIFIIKADLTSLQNAPSSSPASCDGQPLNILSCNVNSSASSISSMLFTACNVAQVTSIEPLSITFDTMLTITGKLELFSCQLM
jgi:hypothetical protein